MRDSADETVSETCGDWLETIWLRLPSEVGCDIGRPLNTVKQHGRLTKAAERSNSVNSRAFSADELLQSFFR